MRYCSFEHQDAPSFGFLLDDWVVDLPAACRNAGPSLTEVLGQARDLRSWLGAGDAARRFVEKIVVRDLPPACRLPLDQVRLLPPIPNPQKIVAIGLNYRDHAEEQNAQLPQRPLIFAKFPSSLIGPEEAIVLPDISEKVDPEAELCAVIGKQCRSISAQQAVESIAGFMVANDVSARDLQYSDRQWVRGKSCDTFAPCGPFLVTADEVGDPHALKIALRVNGDTRQSSTTSNLIFDCYQLVSFISQAITLVPGDLIFTGTPAGVGVFRTPPVFLKAGDMVEVEIEKLGLLRNPVE